MKINIQGESYQESTAYGPTPECPQEKNLFDGGEWIMDNNISNVRINGTSVMANNYVNENSNRGNRFLEIKERQELDKIMKKYREEKKALIAADRINKMLLETTEKIDKIYEEERSAKKFFFDMEYHIAKETREKIDELKKEKDGKIATIREKYAEVAALVEDMPASDKIKIYERYEIL